MCLLIIFICLVYQIVTAIQQNDTTIDYIYQPLKTGYNLAYKTSNGIQMSESAKIGVMNGKLYKAVEGSYEYTGPSGLFHLVKYIADENGYRTKFSIGQKPLTRQALTQSAISTTEKPKNVTTIPELPPRIKDCAIATLCGGGIG